MVVQWSFLHHLTPILYYGRKVVILSSLQHDLYIIMVVQWSFPHHFTPVLYYDTVVIPSSFLTCTLLWSYSGHSFIITARPVLYYGRTVVILSSLQHDLYFIMVVKWSFFHHYSTTCTLLWSYNGHSLIISHLYFIMIVQWSFPHNSSTIYSKLTTTAVPMVVSVHMPYRGLFSLRNQS